MPLSSAATGSTTALAVGDQPAVRHVRDQREAEDDAEERADVGRDLRVLAERRDDVERDDDARPEEEQHEFGPALGFGAERVTQGAGRGDVPRVGGRFWTRTPATDAGRSVPGPVSAPEGTGEW